jgi:Fic family protein
MRYIWQDAEWPNFTWDETRIAPALAGARQSIGYILGLMAGIGFRTQEEAELAALTDTIDNSGKIEGENLGTEAIRSSVARRLGVDIGGLLPQDRHIDGVVEMMLDATKNCAAPLTEERLFGWQAALFPTGRSGIGKIRTGDWRDDADGPMRVISGPMGREKVHYEAPGADRVPDEMNAFISWFNESAIDPVLKSALAHLKFVTIHPFEDGNGRLARAIADMALARADGSPMRFYSVTSEIRKERVRYYEILEETQKGGLDVTGWILWYLDCLDRALETTKASIMKTRERTAFWTRANELALNDRQKSMLRLMLDGFEGKMTTSKWAALCKCSQDTAGRDIAGLAAAGLLVRGPEGGRSTGYEIEKRIEIRQQLKHQ